jgi:Protein of unknown function (DUF2637)
VTTNSQAYFRPYGPFADEEPAGYPAAASLGPVDPLDPFDPLVPMDQLLDGYPSADVFGPVDEYYAAADMPAGFEEFTVPGQRPAQVQAAQQPVTGQAGWAAQPQMTQPLATPVAASEPPSHAAHAAHAQPRHRRRLLPPPGVTWLKAVSLSAVAFTAVVVALISTLGGMVSYDPLRGLAAAGTPHGLAALWPLLVYGPWVVASVSILRAALYRRRCVHSWAVVVLFSAIAGMLCVVQAPKTLPGIAVTVLPALTVLVSFHQFVRQITLTAPARHALPRPRSPRSER